MDFLNTEEKKQRRMVHLPMGRFGEAIEQAKAALFCECICHDGELLVFTGVDMLSVASDDSSYMTVNLQSFSNLPFTD